MSSTTSWAEGLAAARAWVLHKASGVVGRAKHLHQRGEYVSALNQRPVDAAVLELESGHSFVAEEQAFLPLSDEEAGYHALVSQLVANLMAGATKLAEAKGVEPQVALALARAAFEEARRRLARLDARHNEGDGGGAKPPPKEPDR